MTAIIMTIATTIPTTMAIAIKIRIPLAIAFDHDSDCFNKSDHDKDHLREAIGKGRSKVRARHGGVSLRRILVHARSNAVTIDRGSRSRSRRSRIHEA